MYYDLNTPRNSHYNMKTFSRITIMLDSELDKKLRAIQAKNIVQNQGTYSFSRTLNDIVRKGLKA